MPSIAPKVLRRIHGLLGRIIDSGLTHEAIEAGALYEIVGRAIPPKKYVLAARRRKDQKQERHRDKMAMIRGQVTKRAGGKCESCGARTVPICDHFFSGSGRRRQLQSERTCWVLCRVCNEDKTNNMPNARYWVIQFASHCRRHGYEEEAQMAERRLAP